MTLTRRQLQPEELTQVVDAYDAPLDGRMRVVYTRQMPGEWKFCIGRCVFGAGEEDDRTEKYRNIAFISRTVQKMTVKGLLEMISGIGFEMGAGLPPVRNVAPHLNWSVETVPSHATASKMPARMLTASIENSAFFLDSQLLDYTLPYRVSASHYVKEFLGLNRQDSVDGRRGEFSVAVPDQRGAILLGDGRLSIAHRTADLRLVGEINGSIPVDIKNDAVFEFDDKKVEGVELWLLATDGEIVDCLSTTNWPYKYDAAPQRAAQERQLLDLIRRGESERCEFKQYIDLDHPKASDIEKAVCAFSNHRGGTLFIGISDEAGIVGLAKELSRRGRKNRESQRQDLESLTSDYEKSVRTRLRESLEDNQCFNSSVVRVSGTYLVIVEVVQARDVNYLVKSNDAYTRHGATNARMSPPEIQAKRTDDAQSVLRQQIFGS